MKCAGLVAAFPLVPLVLSGPAAATSVAGQIVPVGDSIDSMPTQEIAK